MKKLLLIFAISFLLVLMFLTVCYPWLGLGTGLEQNVENILLPASKDHLFGTDTLGRELLSRVLLGGRISLLVGLACSVLSFLFGFTYGAVAGWFEGITDRVLMRFLDILMAIPSFILVSILCMSLQVALPFEDIFIKALFSLCLGISATHWMSLARVTRGMVLEIKRKPFVEAAVALGGTRTHILLRHLLPNMLGTLLILMALQIPTNILYESFMSFIGLGIHPPYTSWGILVREGWKTLSSFPHLILYPSLILFLTVWSFHIILDALKTKFRL
ncbi:MAG: peptide ABC transporter permease [Bdellovibrio sp. ArHS]|uniref:ABC transporter permease n=1 Tax=Bdellovibrio sp. ArHS TaxID=1569284 RepID=UPI00058267A7|nr:ABC transporter permease [Bdellovibrio sp. ArHS]KHD88334.1 MAG: peptide ABC transporter permease [Bdellovibrio sp. ArHS]